MANNKTLKNYIIFVLLFTSIASTVGYIRCKDRAEKDKIIYTHILEPGIAKNTEKITRLNTIIQLGRTAEGYFVKNMGKAVDSTELTKNIDTVYRYLLYFNNLKKKDKEISSLQDSINQLKSESKILLAYNNNILLSRNTYKLLLENMDSTMSSIEVAKYTANAKRAGILKGATSQKRSMFNFFKPQKNYFKLIQLDSLARLSNLDYNNLSRIIDYQGEIDIQARSTYNFTTNSVSVGLGTELRFNRFVTSAAWLVNPQNLSAAFKSPAFSAGLRYNFFRRKLPYRF